MAMIPYDWLFIVLLVYAVARAWLRINTLQYKIDYMLDLVQEAKETTEALVTELKLDPTNPRGRQR